MADDEAVPDWKARYTEMSMHLAFVIRPIAQALDECDGTLASGVLDQPGAGHLGRAAAAYCIACLSVALQRLDDANMRINFTDDVDCLRRDKSAGDITDLVAQCRNAACHYDSKSRHMKDGPMLYIDPIFGKRGFSGGPEDGPLVTVECEYEDDCALCYGSLRIYRDRHIRRAIAEARQRIGDDEAERRRALGLRPR
ncbi:hypothetical protein [Paraburkholderia tropica]|uniref:hypothetical protein n=1 Tax=Paraburkholderia tropica TaxID=92647 RepID=UPI002AB7DAAE|nr:hypothetical protein [Paraburkholderia tropica]